MVTHAEIVRRIGPDAIATALGVSVNTVRSWIIRNSIPADHWLALSELGHATLDELAQGAAKRSERAA